MNNERRNKLAEACKLINKARSIVEETCLDEQESFDNLSEDLQQSERGQKSEEAIQTLDEAASTLDQVIADLEGTDE